MAKDVVAPRGVRHELLYVPLSGFLVNPHYARLAECRTSLGLRQQRENHEAEPARKQPYPLYCQEEGSQDIERIITHYQGMTRVQAFR